MQPVDDIQSPLLVRLHGESEARPFRQRRIVERVFEYAQCQQQTIGFLGVDRQRDSGPARITGQTNQLFSELALGALALGYFESWAQGRELHRDAVTNRQIIAGLDARADDADGVAIRIEVFLGILARQRGFAKHVEGESVSAVRGGIGLREGRLDRAAHDELVAHDRHRLAHRRANHGLAEPVQHAREQRCQVQPLDGILRDYLSGEHQRPGRHVDHQRIARAQMRVKVRRAELIRDELIGGLVVRDAQQSFRDAHQDDPFVGREIVLLNEGVEASRLLAIAPHRDDEPARYFLNTLRFRFWQTRDVGKGLDTLRLGAEVIAAQRIRWSLPAVRGPAPDPGSLLVGHGASVERFAGSSP